MTIVIENIIQQIQENKQNIKLTEQQIQNIKQQIINRVNKFEPDDQGISTEIKNAMKIYNMLLEFDQHIVMKIQNEEFICNLAFFIQQQKENDSIINCINFIQHQFFTINQQHYAKSILLFKAISQKYEHIHQKQYERLVYLMLQISMKNKQLISYVGDPYYFLEILLQILNRQNQPVLKQKLLNSILKLYQNKKNKNIQLFKYSDIQILFQILAQTVQNQQDQKVIIASLNLFLKLQSQSKQKHYGEMNQDFKNQKQIKQVLRGYLQHREFLGEKINGQIKLLSSQILLQDIQNNNKANTHQDNQIQKVRNRPKIFKNLHL